MFIILNIFLVLSSLIFWPYQVNDSFWVIKESVFVLGCFSMLVYSFHKKSINHGLKDNYIALFLLYVCLGFMWFFYSPFINANGKVMWNFWNFRPTINIILAILIIKLLFEYAESMKDWIIVGKVISWLGGCFAIYSIFQYFGVDQVFGSKVKFLYENGFPSGEQRMVTFFGNSFITSGFLAICSPMCLIFKGWRYKIFYVAIFTALVLMDKTMALAAFAVALSLYLIMNRKFIKLLLLIASCAGFGIYCFLNKPEFFSMTGRFEVWNVIFEKFIQAPYFGYGLGYFEMLRLKSNGLDVFFAHNEYLQNLIDLGIIGSSIIFLFFIDLGRKAFHVEGNILLTGYICGLVAVLVLSIGSFPLRIAPLALIAIIYIAGILYQSKGELNG
jgi:O-antigen ligase